MISVNELNAVLTDMKSIYNYDDETANVKIVRAINTVTGGYNDVVSVTTKDADTGIDICLSKMVTEEQSGG